MEDNVFIKARLGANPFHMMPVEIIIPFYNEHAKVALLVNDIFGTVLYNRYLITLVDDGSENKNFTKQLLEKNLEGVRILSHSENRGFGASVNTAIKNPFTKDIPFVVVLHSDVRLKEANWLSTMGESLLALKNNGIKMVGSTTNNPVVDNKKLFGERNKPLKDVVLDADEYLPMYSAICNRQLFEKTGLLQELPYAGTEAREFAVRMKRYGFSQAVCGKSWVWHEGGGTLNSLTTRKKVKEILEATENKFFPKNNE